MNNKNPENSRQNIDCQYMCAKSELETAHINSSNISLPDLTPEAAASNFQISKVFRMNDMVEISRPSTEQFDEIRSIFQKFISEQKNNLKKLTSFICTPLIIGNRLCIYLGAENYFDIENDLPESFYGYKIQLEFNSIELSSGLDHLYQLQAKIKPVLKAGCEIGSNETSKSICLLKN